MMGSTYLIPVFVQTTLGFTPLDAGMMMMPAGLMLAFIFPAAGRLSDMLPPALMILGGLLLFAAGFLVMAGADANTTFWTMAGVTMISRLGLGLINPTLNAASLRAVAPELVRQSAGAANFMRQLGGAFGINLMVVLLELRIRFHADALTATQDFANATTERMLNQLERMLARAGLPPEAQKAAALDYLGTVVHGQSSTLAFQDTFIIIAGVAVAALLPAYILSRAQRQDAKPTGAPSPRPA
jgi:MFS transporter, DHA2 family, multidrug resistance protein